MTPRSESNACTTPLRFMIPNPDGVITKDGLLDSIAASLISDVNIGNEYSLRILLDYLPDGGDIWKAYTSTSWYREIKSRYTQNQFLDAARQWVEEEISVTWTEFSILGETTEIYLPDGPKDIIFNKLKGTIVP